jgi:hypothetical protein
MNRTVAERMRSAPRSRPSTTTMRSSALAAVEVARCSKAAKWSLMNQPMLPENMPATRSSLSMYSPL